MSTNVAHATFGLPVTVTWDMEQGRWYASIDFSDICDALTESSGDDAHEIVRGLRVMQVADLLPRCSAPVVFVSNATQRTVQVTL